MHIVALVPGVEISRPQQPEESRQRGTRDSVPRDHRLYRLYLSQISLELQNIHCLADGYTCKFNRLKWLIVALYKGCKGAWAYKMFLPKHLSQRTLVAHANEKFSFRTGLKMAAAGDRNY